MENKTKTVTVHRANDTFDGNPIAPCTIVIREPVSSMDPSGQVSLAQLAAVFCYEADAIADALYESLPQGVTHRVMIRLMQRYANQYAGGPKR